MRPRVRIALGVALLALAPAPAHGEDAGGPEAAIEIRVLTYNVHGLASWAARDAPRERLPRIGALANGYEVALVQEDFAHHAALLQGAAHASVERGNPSRLPGWLCPICEGSGLTLLVRWPESIRALANVPYGVCAGWLGQGNDCFASKGFQHARVRLPGGWLVDFVNTHLDAGESPTDQGARRRQLARLQAHLLREAAERPLVVAGDFNLDDDDPVEVGMREAFVSALGLADSGARPAPDGPWDRIDYLFVRDGSATRLEVLESGEDPDFADRGEPLSDHPALFARIRVSPRAPRSAP